MKKPAPPDPKVAIKGLEAELKRLKAESKEKSKLITEQLRLAQNRNARILELENELVELSAQIDAQSTELVKLRRLMEIDAEE